MRHEHEVNSVGDRQLGHMAQRQLGREAEVGARHARAQLADFVGSLAGKLHAEAQCIEETLPQRIVGVGQQRLGQAHHRRLVRNFHAGATLAPQTLAQAQGPIIRALAHLLLAGIAAAHVAPRGRARHTLDLGKGDGAVVLTEVAGFLAQDDLALVQVEATKARRTHALFRHGLAHQPGHAKGTHHVAVGRYHDLHVEQALERGHQGLVPRGGALEHDAVAVAVAVAHHLVEVVLGHRDHDRGQGLGSAGAGLDEAHHVLLHEDGASVGGARGLHPQHGLAHFGHLVAQLVGLFLDERAGAGGAHVVHVGVADVAVDDVHVLGVLAADFEDGVDRGIGEGGARHMGADLVDDGVRADHLAHDLAAAARGPGAQHFYARALLGLELAQGAAQLLRGTDGIAAGLAVHVDQQFVLVVDQRQLGAGRADVDAQVHAQGLARGPGNHAHLVALRVGVGLGQAKIGVLRLLQRERPGVVFHVAGRGNAME